MTKQKTHYFDGISKPKCGAGADKPRLTVTMKPKEVTCSRCKGTNNWKNDMEAP